MSEEFSLPIPLVHKGYSLDADMLSGWRPPSYRTPYPLLYDSDYEYPQSKLCIYQGYRPSESFTIHSEYSDGTDATYPFEYSDPSLISYLSKKNKKDQLPKLNSVREGFDALPEDALTFDSKFECGNLDRVEFINKDEYDLYLRIDTNTGGHMHWFYFSVTNFKYKRTVKFNIVNFTRTSSLFSAGMRPRVFSVQEIKNGQNAGWELGGDNLQFGASKINKAFNRKPLYMLSFTYRFLYPNDKVWFATTIPYTYCRLQKIFRLLKTQENSYIKTSSLCRSLAMIEIPLITITNPNVGMENKRFVVAVARVHPAETVGSWVMEGFLRFIVSKHPEAVMLRNKFVFKIVPMLNPDGVIVGNSRTSMSGNDLNRAYINPDKARHPEITALKELIESLQCHKRVFLFADMHGHFSKKGSFIYGPHFPIHNTLYYKTKVIPRLIGERTEIFRYHSSKFRVSKAKKRAARAVMQSEFNISYSYTLETSYFGYLNQNRETCAFTPETLFLLGEKFARSILEYTLMLEKVIQRIKQRNKHKQKSPSKPEPETKYIEDFNFEIPQLSPLSTLNASKSPIESFSLITYNKEFHTKRKLDEWINVRIMQIIKADDSNFSSSSENSGSEEEGEEEEEEKEPPPVEMPKKKSGFMPKMKLPKIEPLSSTLGGEESVLPKSLVQDIKKNYEFRQPLRSYVTPKKLMDTRQRSPGPYVQSANRVTREDFRIRDFYRPNSLKPSTAKYEEVDQNHSVQNILNKIAYLYLRVALKINIISKDFINHRLIS